MSMQLEFATRKKAKIKMALQGPSGAGKTYSALLLAHGLCNIWEKIGVIDTENGSSNLYAHLGPFKVMTLAAPFTPEKYSQALSICIKHELEVIIIDSISHEWEGSGGILDTHSAMAGNSFTNWSNVTPRHMCNPSCRHQSISFVLSGQSRIMCSQKRTAKWCRKKWA